MRTDFTHVVGLLRDGPLRANIAAPGHASCSGNMPYRHCLRRLRRQ